MLLPLGERLLRPEPPLERPGQLVRAGRDGLLQAGLGDEGLREPLRHLVEGVADLRHLRRPHVEPHAVGEVPGRDGADPREQPGHRPPHQHRRDHVAERRRDPRREEQRGHGPPDEIAPLRRERREVDPQRDRPDRRRVGVVGRTEGLAAPGSAGRSWMGNSYSETAPRVPSVQRAARTSPCGVFRTT